MNPALYIIGRTDLDSMTPGKFAAQAAHAANMAALKAAERDPEMYSVWANECNGMFGTTITLDGGTEADIRNFIENVKVAALGSKHSSIFAGYVVDPTYPIRDGKVTHLIQLMSVGWVMVDRDLPIWKTLSSNLRLY